MVHFYNIIDHRGKEEGGGVRGKEEGGGVRGKEEGGGRW